VLERSRTLDAFRASRIAPRHVILAPLVSLSFDVPGGALSAAVLAVLFVIAVVVGLREVRSLARDRRLALASMRIATATVAFSLASQPTFVHERLDTETGRLAILFDVSRSTTIADDHGESRAARVRAVAASMGAEHAETTPDVHVFGDRATASTLDDVAAGHTRLADDTRIGDAIRSIAQDDVGAILLVSDGADHEGDAVQAAIETGARIHTLALGSEETPRDDAIANLAADSVGFLRRTAHVRVTVRSLGASGERTVSLRQGERVLREEHVVLQDGEEREVDLTFVPAALGRALYHVSMPIEDGDVVPANNDRAFLVRTLRDDLRVLLVAGQPSWDQRFLRAFLERDPTTDLISFFILRQTADMTMADPDDLALIPFPVDELFSEHLGSFDVVLFQNFDYGPYEMAQYLPRIRDYVLRGGSFAMIGGPLAFTAAGYAETPLADVLPVDVLPRSTPVTETTTTDRFSPIVAEGAEHHPLVTLAPEPSANAAAWSSLAPMIGVNVVRGLAHDGQLLLRHPTAHAPSGEPLPVLVSASIGRGRVIALMSDTSWRWGLTTGGETGDASAYERFWDRAVRWLARDPALEPARVTTDRESYGPEARIEVSGSLSDARYAPLAGEAITVSIRTESANTVSTVDARTDERGELHVDLVAPSDPAGYVVVAARRGDTSDLAEEPFVVEAGGAELADPRANHALLAEIARATSGTAFTSASTPSIGSLDTRRVRSLGVEIVRPFASPWAFVVAVAIFAAEWVLRRRWGLR
jgi:uncharacterized membrane protein